MVTSGMRARICVVDDDPAILKLVSRILRDEYEVETTSSPAEALSRLSGSEPADLLITDISMPEMSGLELLAALRENDVHIPKLVLSGGSDIQTAVQAVREGAADFIEKPFHKERLLIAVHNAVQSMRTNEAHLRMKEDATSPLVGESAAMTKLRQIINKVAPSEGRVLILGENGTGKELVAQSIHDGSMRRGAPFVKLNCSAVPKDLVESELFGHEKGAFTGAIAMRRGRFELADNGTLFLDEVGDMPLDMQTKLLRVLQEGTFERVGGSKSYSVNVRVLAATNRDLNEMIAKGTFRQDLYYRLAVVEIHVPPMRERLEDVPLLSRHFIAETAATNRKRDLKLSEGAESALASHTYPGNVRELQNIIERLGIFAEGNVISETDVRAALKGTADVESQGMLYRPGQKLSDIMHHLERQVIAEAIEHHQGNKSATAKSLEVERSHFYKKCKSLGIQ